MLTFAALYSVRKQFEFGGHLTEFDQLPSRTSKL